MNDTLGIESVGQIAITCSDLAASKAFYKTVLGLPLLFEVPPNLAFFQCGDVRLMLTTQQGDEKDHHTSAIYYKVGNISHAFKLLKNKGVACVQEPQFVAEMDDHDLWMGFIRDPDDHLIGLMAEESKGTTNVK